MEVKEGEEKVENEGQEARAEEEGGEQEGGKDEEELRMQQLQREEELEAGPVAMQEQVESAWQGAPQERRGPTSPHVLCWGRGGTPPSVLRTATSPCRGGFDVNRIFGARVLKGTP